MKLPAPSKKMIHALNDSRQGEGGTLTTVAVYITTRLSLLQVCYVRVVLKNDVGISKNMVPRVGIEPTSKP